MIIIKFQGALGNQMFEYAFLRKLNNVYPDSTILAHVGNIKDFNGYELENVFNVSVNRADWKQVARLSNDYPREGKYFKLLGFMSKILRIINGPKSTHLKEDDNSAFYPDVLTLNPLGSYYLDGVWANTQYIEDIREELLNDFRFKNKLDGNNLIISEQMKKEESVSIHVRRNEYVTMGLTVTSDDYYRRAIQIIKSRVENPVFYVFSDDHVYCKSLFSGLIDYTLVEENIGSNSYKDMQLMTFCKHNIVANSTFSFWGAYLGENSDKIVIAPNLSWGHMNHPFARKDWIIIDA